MSSADRTEFERDWETIAEHLQAARTVEDRIDDSAPPLPTDRLDALCRRVSHRIEQRIDEAIAHASNPDSVLSPAAPAHPATAAGAAPFSSPTGAADPAPPSAAPIAPGWSRAGLEQLMMLARLYRDCSPAELATALGRPADRLVPSHDALTLELLQRLAGQLDWTVHDVIDAIEADVPPVSVSERRPASDGGLAADDFAQLDLEMARTFRAGAFHEMLELARRARAVARTPEQRALVCNRMSGAWDGLGYYERARREARRGLEEPQLPDDLHTMLVSNLANAHYTLWEPFEAQAIATGIVEQYGDRPPASLREERNFAWALYVRGHSYRRLIATDPEQSVLYARQARRDLVAAETEWTRLAEADDHEGYRAIAHTCRGGLVEVDVALGRHSAEDAIETLRRVLDDFAVPGREPEAAMLESCGWWCIFACNVATRYLPERNRSGAMERLLDTAYTIAARLPNWALRERVFTMEHTAGRRSTDRTDSPDRVRLLVGTMGRFRRFRSIGWEMLGCA